MRRDEIQTTKTKNAAKSKKRRKKRKLQSQCSLSFFERRNMLSACLSAENAELVVLLLVVVVSCNPSPRRFPKNAIA